MIKKKERNFLDWLWDFEFNLYGLPVPSEVFFLKYASRKMFRVNKKIEKINFHILRQKIYTKKIKVI